MTRSENMEHVEVLRHMKETIKAIMPSEVAALDAAIASLSAPQPPAEAQPERYACNGPEGTFWTDDAALANKLIGAAFDRDEWTVTDTQNPTGAAPPPSAPVGVEGLVVKWKKESESLDIHPAGLAARRVCAIELEHALAQQPAAVDEVISAARAVAKEHDGPLETIIYDSDDDEAGDRVCCRVRSYEPHAEGCPLIRLRAALAAQQGGES